MHRIHAWLGIGALLLAGCLLQPAEPPPAPASAPTLQTAESAIIGGRLATTAEYPAVVALRVFGVLCSGTLIAPQWVLTAAHCVEDALPSFVDVIFDDEDLNDGAGYVVDAVEVIAHPRYDEDLWNHDVGLIKLTRPVTDRPPAPLRRVAIPPGTDVVQLGYGDSTDDRGQTGVLRKLATRSLDCAQLGDAAYRGDRLLCFSSADGDGSCYGDSGGPTFVKVAGKRFLVGVASGGTDDSCKRGYDLHTLVPAELDFILQHVPELTADDGLSAGAPEPNDPSDRADPPSTRDGEQAGCATAGRAPASPLGASALLLIVILDLRRPGRRDRR